MADLEEHAIKRDKGFLVRLVVLLVIGAVGGLLMYQLLIGERVAGCAATTFGAVGDEPAH